MATRTPRTPHTPHTAFATHTHTPHTRNRGNIDAAGQRIIDAVNTYLDDNREYWPMTLRALHYALAEGPLGQVRPPLYTNTKRDYKRLGVLLTKARLSGAVPWHAMADNARTVLSSSGYLNAESFIRQESRYFLKGYARDLAQSQPVTCELWIEKDTLARIAHSVAEEYGISVIVARGYSSVSFVNDCRRRVEERWRAGKGTRILYFGDMDPSGWNMLPAMMTTLQQEMGIGSYLETVRCALTAAQIKRFKLPNNPDALKDDAWQALHGDPTKTKGDPRAEAYKRQFGKLSVELDALGPRRLQALVRASIEENIDMTAYRREQKAYERDVKTIAKVRAAIEKYLPDDAE